MKKYLIMRDTKHFKEVRTNSLLEAIRIRKRLREEEPGPCYLIKVPFRKRHPDFPIWFSLLTLLLVGIAQALD